MNFDEYMETNPRKRLIDTEFKVFFEYAKKRYSKFDQVNWTSYDGEEEFIEELKDYLEESMEALLLFKGFCSDTNQKKGDES